MEEDACRWTTAGVIRWWELRRLLFNLLLLIVGIASIAGMELVMRSLIPPGDDAVEPFVVVLGAVAYGIMANLCYTLGWIIELRARKLNPMAARQRARVMFRLGTVLSCLITTAPFWFACFIWVMHRVRGGWL